MPVVNKPGIAFLIIQMLWNYAEKNSSGWKRLVSSCE